MTDKTTNYLVIFLFLIVVVAIPFAMVYFQTFKIIEESKEHQKRENVYREVIHDLQIKYAVGDDVVQELVEIELERIGK